MAITLESLSERIDSLQQSFIQAQKNQVSITEKADSTNTIIKKVDETSDNTKVTTETVDGIMTDVIPELAEADANLTATIDSILTDIIPSIIGE